MDYPSNYTATEVQGDIVALPPYFDQLNGHYDGVNDPALQDIEPFDTKILITRSYGTFNLPETGAVEDYWFSQLKELWGEQIYHFELKARQIDGMPAHEADFVNGFGGPDVWVYMFFDEDNHRWMITYVGGQSWLYPEARRDFDQIVDTFRFLN